MAEDEISRREWHRRKRESGFVGRNTEINAFRAIFSLSPRNEDYQCLFHVFGQAGVGKTWLVRRWESTARTYGAATAYLGDEVHGIIEAMDAISGQLCRQEAPLRTFDKQLATYRQLRHEVENALLLEQVAGSEADSTGASAADSGPSVSSTVAARVGLVGLGMVPVLGALAGAIDTRQLAQGGDRLRAAVNARLRSHDDAQLVLEPVRVLTPVFLRDIARVARHIPWVVLFFDTYERTRTVLDGWLRDLVVDESHGELPMNVVVVLSGQGPLDADWSDSSVAEMPLDVFTADEARQLLARRGITDGHLVEEILHVSGCLPVLVDTLARSHPHSPDAVADLSDTAVERFLKWETDPGHRAAALACALPLNFNEDVYHAAVIEPVPGGYRWLTNLPFVTRQGDRRRYHDVVRAQMLRTRRTQSPARWREDHTRLADTFGRWRAALEDSLPADTRWDDAAWQEFRLCETYHRLCAQPQMSLPEALHAAVQACDQGTAMARRWAQMLWQASQDAGSAALAQLGAQLQESTDDAEDAVPALTLLLANPSAGNAARALALAIRGREHRTRSRYEDSLADYSAAVELAPTLSRAYAGRASTYAMQENFGAALADFDRAIALNPLHARAFANRGYVHRMTGRYAEALADYDRAIALDPHYPWAVTGRGQVHGMLGRYREALADYNRVLESTPNYARAIAGRGQALRCLGRYDEALAAHNRAIELTPEYAGALADRAEVRRRMGRHEKALADFDRAIALSPRYAWAIAHRGATHLRLGHHHESLADFDRALGIEPAYSAALACRARAHRRTGHLDRARADSARALRADPASALVRHEDAVLATVCGSERAADAWCGVLRSDAADEADGEGAQAMDARWHLMAACCALGDWDAAAGHVDRFAASAPNRYQLREARHDLADLASAIALPHLPVGRILRRLEGADA
jgi:tetratricopeptide (TPR) repeat protein